MPETATALHPAIELESRYLLQNYARYPLVLQRGKGCWLYDTAGKRYLDFIAGIGVNALGHAHPRIMRIIRQQAGLLIHSSNLYYHEYQGPLARRLVELSGLERAFFANSGTEVMELAIKMIHAHGRTRGEGKHEIVALDNSFHGRSVGALAITGQAKYRTAFEPLMPGARFVPGNDVAALEAAVGPQTAGIVIEWIQGEGGIYPISQEFAARARQLADQYDALLIMDEIQCGLGRTGRAFAYQNAEPALLPDVVVTAKPLAAGLPLGALICNQRAASSIGPGMHGTTFGGGALACRVSLEFLDIMQELLPSLVRMGGELKAELAEMGRRHAFVREVRGFGLMIGIELAVPGKQIVLDAMDAGLLVNCTHDTVIRMLPPYIINEREVDRAVTVLGKVFKNFRPS